VSAFRWRIIWRVLAVVLGLIALLAIALPMWFPWVLRPILHRVGIDYERYERIGYNQFALITVHGQAGSTRFNAHRLQANLPATWLWRKWRGDLSAPFLTATDWSVQLAAEAARKSSTTAPHSSFEVLDRAAGNFSRLANWLPVARLNNGLIVTGTNEIVASSIQWKRGELIAQLHLRRFEQNATLRGNFHRRLEMSLAAEPAGFTTELSARRRPSAWLVEGSAVWPTSRVDFASEFLPKQWRPARLQARADHLQIPASLLKLRDYSTVTGSFSADWVGNRLEAKLMAAALPATTNLPVMRLQFQIDSASKLALTGANLGPVDQVSVRGDLRWPEIEIEQFVATMRGQSYESRRVSRVTFGRQFVKLDAFQCVSPFGEIFLAADVHWPGRGTLQARLQDEGTELTLNAQWNESAEVHLSGHGRARRLAGLADATLDAQIDGPSMAPTGHVVFAARNLTLEAGRGESPMPEIENLHVNLEIEPRLIRALIAMSIENQPVSASAEMPVDTVFWTDLYSGRRSFDWHRATAEVHVDEAQLAPFARFAPKVLSPEGTFSLNLAVREGRELFGQLRLRHAATRPIPPIAPVRDVDLNVVFDGRGFELKEAHAQVGGAPLRASGHGQLPKVGALEFDFMLTGENIPLARQPDLVLRSTVALNLVQTRGQTTLRGELRLRDSLFLQELKSLMSGRLEQPRSRPPYFSIETQPLADWKLDLHVVGERFLRVRTPVFRDEASVNLHLGGTLREPVALGEARINSASIQFPFGSIKVEHGSITLSSDNPYQPQMFIHGTGQAYGYNIKMEITGGTDEPQITFSSTPPLSSEQILLMLTAGEIPRTEFTLSTRERANRLAVFFARNLLTQLGFGEEAAERLTIRPGEQIAEQGGVTYYIEYRLTDRWSATAEYDRFNALNAGLKWKIISK
jgi:hypothetical protein